MPAAPNPSTRDPILTQMRRVIWQAIDAWPRTAGVFRRTYTFERQEDRESFDNLRPSIGDMPAIAVMAAGVETAWSNNQQQEIPYGLAIAWWTPHLDLLPGERIWEDLVTAFWQAKPQGSSQTFWQSLGLVDLLTTTPAAQQMDDDPKSVRWDMGVVLKKRWNPRTYAGAY